MHGESIIFDTDVSGTGELTIIACCLGPHASQCKFRLKSVERIPGPVKKVDQPVFSHVLCRIHNVKVRQVQRIDGEEMYMMCNHGACRQVFQILP